MKKRIVTLLLAIVMLAAVSSCANGKNPDTTTAAKSESTVAVDPNDPQLAAIDWEGAEFNILYNGSELEPNLDFIGEEQTGATLNDAVYKRNTIISEKYNLRFELQKKSDSGILSAVETAISTGDIAYHLVEANQNYSMKMAINGTLHELSELTHIDTSKSYWFTSALAGSSIAGQNYFAYSDANVHAFGATPVTIFNKTVAKDFNIDDIYSTVENGGWTLEQMSKLVKQITGDLDGDQKITNTDRLGLICNTFAIDCFISGSGHQMIVKDEDDLPVLNIAGETFQNIMQSIQDLCKVENGTFLCDRWGSGTEIRDYWPEYAITENRALFWIGNFKCVERLRRSEADFGVIPIPKASSDQKDYKVHMQANIGAAMSVPTCVLYDELDMTSSVLEDIAYYSSKEVMPVYMEVLIQGQSIRDVESLKCIKIIRNSYYCDMGFMLSEYGIKALSEIRTIVKDGKPVSSLYSTKGRAYENYLSKISDMFR